MGMFLRYILTIRYMHARELCLVFNFVPQGSLRQTNCGVLSPHMKLMKRGTRLSMDTSRNPTAVTDSPEPFLRIIGTQQSLCKRNG